MRLSAGPFKGATACMAFLLRTGHLTLEDVRLKIIFIQALCKIKSLYLWTAKRVIEHEHSSEARVNPVTSLEMVLNISALQFQQMRNHRNETE